jgi:hypothetical protein
MIDQDEYVFYINEDKNIFYYKNKKLHREAGPAVVLSNDIDRYIHLSDKTLYKEVFTPVTEDSEKNDYEIEISYYDGFNFTYEAIKQQFSSHNISTYYWEGIPCNEKEFAAYKMKKALDMELAKKEFKEPSKTKV